MNKPLADRMRPIKLEDVVGQEHILSKNQILNKTLQAGHITNMIFYGPPGVGKTTVANIISNMTNKKLYKLNATNASIKDIQRIVAELDSFMTMNGVLLYLDEIQNFNKKQQQSLLEYIENGKITLIASTTENPYHYIYNAILSRSTVFEFKLLTKSNVIEGLKQVIKRINDEGKTLVEYEEEALDYIATASNGDLRRAMNALELAMYAAESENKEQVFLTIHIAQESTQKKVISYDKFGDQHYDILSAFQKSIRGTDPDAAIHYLARLVKAGDLNSICRRLLVIASEDIGLAYPTAITIVKSCVDAAMQVGFPEARINLAQATLVLATAPKSNSVIEAMDRALADLDQKDIGEIPTSLKDAHYKGASDLGRGVTYKYPHHYENNYIQQQYLPENIKNEKYYGSQNNKMEQRIFSYLEQLKKQ
ncbi:AAA ATPase, central domain protein [Alkaliphilus metalliredigens QYMF]|uniref:AAA ATPase, central domain protein n=1 Tax=Alkaliphilus metalliredigens (strain QYMF) TaxID=293826 RepID=A6TQY2_ALKMQ|nr:replication-associated recombination protein A [Alkaliphilus metalliredigens]ABR48600.1 AAA ATPase, central domain protein [Alkaliphilus metalliredigens QYMF]